MHSTISCVVLSITSPLPTTASEKPCTRRKVSSIAALSWSLSSTDLKDNAPPSISAISHHTVYVVHNLFGVVLGQLNFRFLVTVEVVTWSINHHPLDNRPRNAVYQVIISPPEMLAYSTPATVRTVQPFLLSSIRIGIVVLSSNINRIEFIKSPKFSIALTST